MDRKGHFGKVRVRKGAAHELSDPVDSGPHQGKSGEGGPEQGLDDLQSNPADVGTKDLSKQRTNCLCASPRCWIQTVMRLWAPVRWPSTGPCKSKSKQSEPSKQDRNDKAVQQDVGDHVHDDLACADPSHFSRSPFAVVHIGCSWRADPQFERRYVPIPCSERCKVPYAPNVESSPMITRPGFSAA